MRQIEFSFRNSAGLWTERSSGIDFFNNPWKDAWGNLIHPGKVSMKKQEGIKCPNPQRKPSHGDVLGEILSAQRRQASMKRQEGVKYPNPESSPGPRIQPCLRHAHSSRLTPLCVAFALMRNMGSRQLGKHVPLLTKTPSAGSSIH